MKDGNRDDLFEGHDVLIVFGACSKSDRKFRQECFSIQRRILTDDISLVLLIYDATAENAKANANELLSALQMLLKASPLKRIFRCVAYNDLCEHFPRSRNFSLSIYQVDKTMEVPPVCRNVMQSGFSMLDSRLLGAYDDIPEIKGELQLAASILASSSSTNASCVLLTGPTGCGKSFTAEVIYNVLKERKILNGRFIQINCASLPKDLIDAYLFGVPKRMYTEVSERKGAIEEAEDGVLFLDEIGNLSFDAQSHLLTFIDKGIYFSSGEYGSEKHAKCKLVFGTNANLRREVLAERFRHDLYARIKTISIELPTVAERIERNASAFLPKMLENACKANGDLKPTANAKRRFNAFAAEFSWPTNFRDVNNLFTILKNKASASNADGIVSASLMRDVLEQYKCDNDERPAGGETPSVVEERKATGEETPDGLAAYEIELLPFIRKVARESNSRNQAGIKFYMGRELTNYSDAFGKLIAKFGFVWDKSEDGHLKKLHKAKQVKGEGGDVC